jgi:hypothetical protein
MAPMNGSYVINLTFDGLDRDYRIHVPPQAALGAAAAHGDQYGRGNAERAD